MKLYKVIAVIILLINLSELYAQNEKSEATADQTASEQNKKIVILPFYNYSDSSLKYLSNYIPEMIAEYLSIYKGIDVHDPEALRKVIDYRGLTPEILYYEDDALDFLKNINADVGLKGRYIVQGNVIQIDFGMLDVGTEKLINSDKFEAIIDDNLLDTLDRFSRTRTEWFVENHLVILLGSIETKDKSKSEEYLDRIRRSKIGSFFSNKWVFSFIILILFYLLSRLISYIFKRYFPQIKELLNGLIDENLIQKFRKTLQRIIIFFGLKLCILVLEFTPNVYNILNDIITGFIIGLIIYAFVIVVEASRDFWGKDVTDRINPRVNRDLIPLFITFMKISIVSIGVIIILSKFDINVGPFIASIGILGIAIGFAVKDSLADIIGGIFLALDHSIAAGDMVTIDGDIGTIKEVGIRNTKLQTFDNEIIVIPNSELSNKKFKNYVLPDPTFRVVINFSVVYGADVDRVVEVVYKAIDTIEDVLSDPPTQCLFDEMSDFSLNFQAKFWISNYENMLIKKMEATKLIYNALNESDIAIPFPTRTVYLK